MVSVSDIGTSAAQAAPQRLLLVQALRAVAVLFVIISHAMHELYAFASESAVPFDEKLFPGDFGVDLFFVISGFIMIYVSRDSFGKPGAAIDFVIRRLIRIVPLYWLMTSVMIAIVVLMPSAVDTATDDPMGWLSSYFFIPFARASDGMMRPVLGLGWSLNYEMFFYALFAVGLLFSRRIAIAWVIAAMAVTWIAAHTLQSPPAWIGFLGMSVIFEFAAGMVLGLAYIHRQRLPFWFSVCGLVAGVLLLAMAPAFSDHVEEHRHIYYGIPAVLFVSFAVLSGSELRLPLLAPLVHIGEASYATYLTHPFILGGLALLVWKSGMLATVPFVFVAGGYLAIAVFLCLTVGQKVHSLVDLPLTDGLRRVILSPRKHGSAPAAAA